MITGSAAVAIGDEPLFRGELLAAWVRTQHQGEGFVAGVVGPELGPGRCSIDEDRLCGRWQKQLTELIGSLDEGPVVLLSKGRPCAAPVGLNEQFDRESFSLGRDKSAASSDGPGVPQDREGGRNSFLRHRQGSRQAGSEREKAAKAAACEGFHADDVRPLGR